VSSNPQVAYASKVATQAHSAMYDAKRAVDDAQRVRDELQEKLNKTAKYVAERRQAMNAAPGDKAKSRAYKQIVDAEARLKTTFAAAETKLTAAEVAHADAKKVHEAAQRNLDSAKRQSG
jgi:hypothetical protein